MAKHNELGSYGEELAVGVLLQKGYQILERNWRYQKAEIDIIVQKGNTYLFAWVGIEVSRLCCQQKSGATYSSDHPTLPGFFT